MKLKVLAFSDIHGNIYRAKQLANLCEKRNIKLVIAAGDLTYFGKIKDFFHFFFERGVEKMIIVPGNHEEPDILFDYLKENYREKVILLEGDFFTLEDFIFVGFSANNIFPTSKIYSEKESFKILNNVFLKLEKTGKLKNKKLITISHIHPEGFIEKLFPFKGSKSWSLFIKKYKPFLHLHGHIHEGEGIAYTIGNTKVINVGERGKILDLKNLE